MAPRLTKGTIESSLRDCFRCCWKQMTHISGGRKHVTGSDGQSIASLASASRIKDSFPYEAQLINKIMGGSYKVKPLRSYTQVKDNGKKRHICIPTVGDRLAQRSVIKLLEKVRSGGQKLLPFTTSVETGGGRTIRGLLDALLLSRKDHPHVYKTDIKSFFDNIQRDKLAEFIRLERLPQVMSLFLTAAMHAEADKVLEGITPGVGVRQGMPVSPLLASIYLKRFDSLMKRSGLVYARYVDDIIVLCDSEADARRAQDKVRGIFSGMSLGLECDFVAPGKKVQGKSRICGPEDPVTFLGAQIAPLPMGQGYQLEIDPESLQKVEKNLAEYKKARRAIGKRLTVADVIGRMNVCVQFSIAAREGLYGFDEFEAKVKEMQRRITREIFTEWFEVRIDKLSPEMRKVLGTDPYPGRM